jgi:hypothetical protein
MLIMPILLFHQIEPYREREQQGQQNDRQSQVLEGLLSSISLGHLFSPFEAIVQALEE